MDAVFSQLTGVQKETAEWLAGAVVSADKADPKQGLAGGRMVLNYLCASPLVDGCEGSEAFAEQFDGFDSRYRKVLEMTDVHGPPFNLPQGRATLPLTDGSRALTPEEVNKRCFNSVLSLPQQPKPAAQPAPQPAVQPPAKPSRRNPLFTSPPQPTSSLFSSSGGAQSAGGPAPNSAADTYPSYTRPRDEPRQPPPRCSSPPRDTHPQPPRDNYPQPPRDNYPQPDPSGFITASRQLEVDDMKRGKLGAGGSGRDTTRPSKGKTLGVRRAFAPPFKRSEPEPGPNGHGQAAGGTAEKKPKKEEDSNAEKIPPELLNPDGSVPDRLKNIDPEMLVTVCNEVLTSSYVAWTDIAGLDHAKKAVYEAIIWPLQRPDLFMGIRKPTRGLLLFGPPGTGKTMIGKAIASESQSTFFNISASTLMSKWVGEGEKMVRALFAVAAVRQPSVVFIDEVDSLLTQRSDGEQDHTRRLKTEFLVQLDGAGTGDNDRILIVGATNRPQELDEAARRRMEKRLYISLPDDTARGVLIAKALEGIPNSVDANHLALIAKKSKGYSGADLTLLCREAALWPLREEGAKLQNVESSAVRPVVLRDFAQAFLTVKPSVGQKDIVQHVKFNDEYGSFSNSAKDISNEVDHFFDDV